MASMFETFKRKLHDEPSVHNVINKNADYFV